MPVRRLDRIHGGAEPAQTSGVPAPAGIDAGSSPGCPDLSVVVPVYGCAGCLDVLVERLGASLRGVVASYEIILVDDRSPDGAWEVIGGLARVHSSIRALR